MATDIYDECQKQILLIRIYTHIFKTKYRLVYFGNIILNTISHILKWIAGMLPQVESLTRDDVITSKFN